MTLVRRLAERLVSEHPDRAALVLESHPTASAIGLLARVPASEAAEVVRCLSPSRAVDIVTALPPARAAEILEALDLDRASRLARRLDPRVRSAALAQLEENHARSLNALLAFPEGSAGALMDPDVLALPAELTAAVALERVRSEPGHARYNLYAVDAEQRLVGALNLRELLLSRPDVTLADLMSNNTLALSADTDAASVVSHPGWKEVHSLPVIDASGRYLGAVRYRTLRELEEEIRRRQQTDAGAPQALGELFAIGVAGTLEAFAGAIERRERPDAS